MAGYPVKKKKKFSGKAFLPPNYNYIAQNVGVTKKENCGACHFTGGGGNNVKHGDLEIALNHTTTDVDVHMGADGKNMTCTACHKTNQHNIQGQLYSVSSHNKDRTTCEQCHTDQPHESQRINMHANKVACQTCHIPTYAKGAPTKMNWDWSTAGKFKPDGGMLMKKDSTGAMTYHTKKGTFAWGKNVKPAYVWFNGEARHYVMGQKFNPNERLHLNKLLGSYADKNSKIVPVKRFTGKQIYDTENKYMIVPHLFGKDTTSYWLNFDWNKAAEAGMKSVGLPYSGKYGFAETQMDWPVNHMVSPSNESLTCIECHSRNGRLAGINDFYMPGRDYNPLLDKSGFILILLSLIGVTIHASLRFVKSKD